MNLTELVPLLIKVSIMLVAFGFGLKARWSDATYFFRKPRELLHSFLAMNVIMLLFAIALVKIFPLNPAVELALIVLALSPVPPFLPGKQFKAGGDESYVDGLLVGMSLLAIVVAPVLATLTGKLFNLEVRVPPAVIAKVLLMTVLIPVGAGILIRASKPVLAERAAKWVLRSGNILLVIGMVFVLFSVGRAILLLIGNGTILALFAFAAVGLAVGHLLGGPDPENRGSLALATASRHPAVALAIAHAMFPREKRVFAAVLLYLIVASLVSFPYVKWRKHHPGIPHEPGEKMRWRHRPT